MLQCCSIDNISEISLGTEALTVDVSVIGNGAEAETKQETIRILYNKKSLKW